jgi:hypothetical protein
MCDKYNKVSSIVVTLQQTSETNKTSIPSPTVTVIQAACSLVTGMREAKTKL